MASPISDADHRRRARSRPPSPGWCARSARAEGSRYRVEAAEHLVRRRQDDRAGPSNSGGGQPPRRRRSRPARPSSGQATADTRPRRPARGRGGAGAGGRACRSWSASSARLPRGCARRPVAPRARGSRSADQAFGTRSKLMICSGRRARPGSGPAPCRIAMLRATRSAVERADRHAGSRRAHVRRHQLQLGGRRRPGSASARSSSGSSPASLGLSIEYCRPLSSAAVNFLTFSGFSLA